MRTYFLGNLALMALAGCSNGDGSSTFTSTTGPDLINH